MRGLLFTYLKIQLFMDLRFVCTHKVQEHQTGTLNCVQRWRKETESWRTAKIQKIWSSNTIHL